MSFWKIAGEFAKEFGKGYVKERGVKGTMEDLGDFASGVKNFFSSGAESGEEENSISDIYNQYIEDEDYQGALDFVRDYYKGIEKDYAYFYYLGNAQLELARTSDDDSLLNKAVQNLKTAFNKCPSEYEDSSFLKEQYENARDWQTFINDMNDTHEKVQEYIDNQKYDAAIQKWNQYYRKHFNNQKDFIYYSKAYDIYIDQIIMEDDINLQFDKIDEVLSQMGKLATEEKQREEYNSNKNFVFLLKNDNKIAKFRQNGAYDKAIRQIEDYYSTQPNKNDELGYWSRIFMNYFDAIDSGIQIGKSKEEDIAFLRTSLAQRERLGDTEYMEYIEKDRVKMEELLSNLSQSSTSSKSYNDGSSLNSKAAEQEYISELKECLADGIITDRERRLLDKLRKSLGISEERAQELEIQCNPASFTKEEKEYSEEVKACLADDGIITDRERRLLVKLAKSLNISSQRALEIESQILNK